MSKPLVVVSGVNGQLGYELNALHEQYTDLFDFVFTNRQTLDLADDASIDHFFEHHRPAFFINCAAYTAVDKAETDQITAYRINAEAVGRIAQRCAAINCVLIQVSTDYVFNGQATSPYKITDETNPVNYYGYSKWAGEQFAINNNPHTIIIRTSWVYSVHGNNFVKTMLRLMKDRDTLSVVADQLGSPTYTTDLARAIMQVVSEINKGNAHFGIFHYSNAGVTTWHAFATEIRDLAQLTTEIKPITTAEYPTPAKRPAYSVMDTSLIADKYGAVIPSWRDSLRVMLSKK